MPIRPGLGAASGEDLGSGGGVGSLRGAPVHSDPLRDASQCSPKFSSSAACWGSGWLCRRSRERTSTDGEHLAADQALRRCRQGQKRHGRGVLRLLASADLPRSTTRTRLPGIDLTPRETPHPIRRVGRSSQSGRCSGSDWGDLLRGAFKPGLHRCPTSPVGLRHHVRVDPQSDRRVLVAEPT